MQNMKWETLKTQHMEIGKPNQNEQNTSASAPNRPFSESNECDDVRFCRHSTTLQWIARPGFRCFEYWPGQWWLTTSSIKYAKWWMKTMDNRQRFWMVRPLVWEERRIRVASEPRWIQDEWWIDHEATMNHCDWVWVEWGMIRLDTISLRWLEKDEWWKGESVLSRPGLNRLILMTLFWFGYDEWRTTHIIMHVHYDSMTRKAGWKWKTELNEWNGSDPYIGENKNVWIYNDEQNHYGTKIHDEEQK